MPVFRSGSGWPTWSPTPISISQRRENPITLLISLWWSGGNISAKYPQEPTLKKMIQVAAHFGATVVGDEGESCRLDDEGKIAVEGF